LAFLYLATKYKAQPALQFRATTVDGAIIMPMGSLCGSRLYETTSHQALQRVASLP
jgi:hypothetical protein